jgi:alanine racemase
MTHPGSRPTFAKIDLANLRFNFSSAREFIGADLKYMAVVKADAYGHGAPECSRVLEDQGVDWFGVALVEEAVELRAHGIKAPVLCLGGFFEDQVNGLFEFDITPVIFSLAQAKLISSAARSIKTEANVHIKIDSGMGRLGVRWDQLDTFIDEFRKLPNLHVEGLMTHFACANETNENPFTNAQIDRFHNAIGLFENAGIGPQIVDLANSPAAVGHPRSRAQMVRLGGILYGMGGDTLAPDLPKPKLRPVMSLHSLIADLKSVPKGETLGYGRTFTTDRDSKIALVPIGYRDGYRRGLSNRAQVIIKGHYAPVVGRVSMDWTIVDATDVPGISVGDPVILMGQDGDLRVLAEDLAAQLGTISYEITCGIGERVPRWFSH